MVMYSPAVSRKPLRGWLALLGVGMVFGPMRALSNVLAYADPPMGTAFAKFPTLTRTLLGMDVVSLVLVLGLALNCCEDP
jgi:hypothetical protein